MRKSGQVQAAQRGVRLTATVATLEVMDPKPMPVEAWVMSPEDADRLRRLDCRNYDLCLDYAIGMDWRGFGCSQCKAHAPVPKDRRRAISIRLDYAPGDMFARLRRAATMRFD